MLNRSEFEATLASESVFAFWGKRSAAEVETLLGAEAARMVGFDQRNPHHCYDLWNHTLHVVRLLPDGCPTFLRTAAFLHDIGKPAAAKEKQGRLVFYGHAAISAKIAVHILEQLGYDAAERARICFFIRHHDDFISYVLPEESYDRHNPHLIEINAENIGRHLRNVGRKELPPDVAGARELWLNLLDLCRADASAQAEFVRANGVQTDSREHKLAKVARIREIVANLP